MAFPAGIMFAENLGTEIIDIFVGPERKRYVVHKKPLISQSEYFHNAFKGDFKEAQENSIHLEEDDPGAVALLIGWVYRGVIPGTEKKISPFAQSFIQPFSTNLEKAVPNAGSIDGSQFPFIATSMLEPNSRMGNREYYQSICFQPQYQMFSQEELRLADYAVGRKDATYTPNHGPFNPSMNANPFARLGNPSILGPPWISGPAQGPPAPQGFGPGPLAALPTQSAAQLAPSAPTSQGPSLFGRPSAPLFPVGSGIPGAPQPPPPAATAQNVTAATNSTSGQPSQNSHQGTTTVPPTVSATLPATSTSSSANAPTPATPLATTSSNSLFGPVRTAAGTTQPPTATNAILNNSTLNSSHGNSSHSIGAPFSSVLPPQTQPTTNVFGTLRPRDLFGNILPSVPSGPQPQASSLFGNAGSSSSQIQPPGNSSLFSRIGGGSSHTQPASGSGSLFPSLGGGLFGSAPVTQLDHTQSGSLWHTAYGTFPPKPAFKGPFGYKATIEYPKSPEAYIPGIPRCNSPGADNIAQQINQTAILNLCILAERILWPALFNAAIEAYVRGELNSHRPIPFEHVDLIYEKTYPESTLRAYVLESMCTNRGDSLMYMELTRKYDDLMEDILNKLPSLKGATDANRSQDDLIRSFHMMTLGGKGKEGDVDISGVFPKQDDASSS